MYEEDLNLSIDDEVENGGQGEVVDPVEGAEAEEGAGVSEEGNPAVAKRDPPKQTHEDNAAARAARIRTAALLRQEYDSKIADMGVPNPYTGKPFTGFREFEEYGKKLKEDQLAAEAVKTGKTVEELNEEMENRAFLRRKREEEAQQRKADANTEAQKAFLIADVQDFAERYPEVDPEKLEANEKFRKFAGKRLYKEPLGDLYNDFCEIVEGSAQAAVAKAAGKQARGTGGGSGGGGVNLTPKQSAELTEWNRANPDMRMTEKEFLNI